MTGEEIYDGEAILRWLEKHVPGQMTIEECIAEAEADDEAE